MRSFFAYEPPSSTFGATVKQQYQLLNKINLLNKTNKRLIQKVFSYKEKCSFHLFHNSRLRSKIGQRNGYRIKKSVTER